MAKGGGVLCERRFASYKNMHRTAAVGFFLTVVWMKSPDGTVTLVPIAAVMIHVTIDTGSATKMSAAVVKFHRERAWAEVVGKGDGGAIKSESKLRVVFGRVVF